MASTTADGLHVDPLALGGAAHDWDDLHQNLRAAADLIGGDPPAGLSARVGGAAGAWAETWSGHTLELAGRCETRADGLRSAAMSYVDADGVAFAELGRVHLLVREQR